MVGAGKNDGRPESRFRSSASPFAFPGAGQRIGGDVWWAKMNRREFSDGEGTDGVLVWSVTAKVAERVVCEKKRWWYMGQEGGEVEPTQVNAQLGRCAVCARRRWRGGG